MLDYPKWDTHYLVSFSNAVYTTAYQVMVCTADTHRSHCSALARSFITYYSGNVTLAASNFYDLYLAHTNDTVLFFAAYAAAESGVLWICDALHNELNASATRAPALAYALNRCAVAKGSYDDALERSRRVLLAHGDFVLMHLQVIDILVAQHRINEAFVQATNLFFGLQWRDPECAEVTGLLCSVSKHYGLAATAFESVVDSSGTWKHYFLPQYIEALYRSGHRYKARTVLRRFRRSTLESFGNSNMYLSLVATLGSGSDTSEARVAYYIDALLSDYVSTNRCAEIQATTNSFEDAQ